VTFYKRITNRLGWIFKVSFALGNSFGTRSKMIFGGLWLLITDSGKSRLSFEVPIHHFGKTQNFRFEDISDFGLFDEVFLSDNYPLNEDDKIDVIFDIAANVGVSTLYFKMRYPEARVYCYEPDPDNFKRLSTLATKLNYVKAHDIAVWSENTELTFYADPHRGSSSSAIKIRERQNQIQVQAASLDEVVQNTSENHIDILKVDIEGAEEAVFSTWKQIIPVTYLLGEIHGDLCDADFVIDAIKKQFKTIELSPFNDGSRFYVVGSHS